MKLFPVHCDYCQKVLYRSKGRINEAKKFGWKTYCSSECESKTKNKQQVFICSNRRCKVWFKRGLSDTKKSQKLYCSQSCAATVNNVRFKKRKPIIKNCSYCNKEFTGREKYCSAICKNKSQTINAETIIQNIKNFYICHGRIPLKREFLHTKAARKRFGTWNKAIKAAGFKPNPVMFARKHTANDGHISDSLAEKIIDDWLYARKITHQRSVPYPENKELTADFVIGDYWIEFFGLSGGHKRYDQLRKEKLKLAEAYNLKLVEIYPKDLFPENRLDEVLNMIWI